MNMFSESNQEGLRQALPLGKADLLTACYKRGGFPNLNAPPRMQNPSWLNPIISVGPGGIDHDFEGGTPPARVRPIDLRTTWTGPKTCASSSVLGTPKTLVE